MTIFSEFCRELMANYFDFSRDHSRDSDNSFWNKTMSVAGLGRDTELSKEKQKYVNMQKTEIIKLIDAAELEVWEDYKLKSAIKKQISTARKYIRQILCHPKGNNEGKSRKVFVEANTFLDDLFDMCEDHNALDICIDDPFHIFLKYCLSYLCRKRFDESKLAIHGQSFLGVVTTEFADSIKLADEKEKLVERYLQNSIETVQATRNDTNRAVEKQSKDIAQFLYDRAKLIQSDQREACKKYKFDPLLPKILLATYIGSFPLPALKPGMGYLGICMRDAQLELQEKYELDNDLSLTTLTT